MSVTTNTSPEARPKTDRFLLGILVGIGVIVLLAFLSLFALRQPSAQLPVDSPSGTVQRFLTNLGQQQYDKAYELLSNNMTYKPSREEFINYNLNQSSYLRPVQVQFLSEKIEGDSATVNVSITEYIGSGGPFNVNENTFQTSFGLNRENGTWLIFSAPYNYVAPYYKYYFPPGPD